MAKGRKPLSAADVALRGNPGKRAPRVDRRDPTPAPSSFDPPAHLSPKVKSVWRREIARLADLPYLKVSDMTAFGIFCGSMARLEAAQKIVDAKGLTYVSSSKHGELERLRPEVKVIEACERTISKYMGELAMTSTSRLRAASQTATQQLSLPLGDRPQTQAPTANDPGPIGFLNQGAIH